MSLTELCVALLQLTGALIVTVPLGVFLCAVITLTHQTIRYKVSSSSTAASLLTTAIYSGRVSHTRFQPVKHSFAYPLFFCLLDLSEVKKLFKGNIPLMWPLTYFINFRDEDHLKNGEGKLVPDEFDRRSRLGDSLSPRIRQLVKERTNGSFVPSKDQKILLLTHLSYFGYCFNPVSFYYILKEGLTFQPENIEAIVAEVINTPWNEMKCYVLHPDSIDMMEVKDGRSKKISDETNWNDAQDGVACIDGEGTKDMEDPNLMTGIPVDAPSQSNDWKSINYIFTKKFHVSPFMDMNHIYDWSFWHITDSRIMVSTTMKKPIPATAENEGSEKCMESKTVNYFNAFFDIERASFHPLRLCYQLIRFPVYCMIIQVWIHIQAFKLFSKGVQFIPHPEGSETAASKIIGHAMAPFFATKEWFANRGSSQKADGHAKVE